MHTAWGKKQVINATFMPASPPLERGVSLISMISMLCDISSSTVMYPQGKMTRDVFENIHCASWLTNFVNRTAVCFHAKDDDFFKDSLW